MKRCIEMCVKLTRGGCGNAGYPSSRRLTLLRGFAALFVGILVAAAPGALAGATPAPDGAQLYSLNCVVCHGEDGKGTETGKSLQAPDLGSAAVQKQTNAMLAQIISEGKNNMPPFMSTLSKADIQSLVAYVRTFAKKK